MPARWSASGAKSHGGRSSDEVGSWARRVDAAEGATSSVECHRYESKPTALCDVSNAALSFSAPGEAGSVAARVDAHTPDAGEETETVIPFTDVPGTQPLVLRTRRAGLNASTCDAFAPRTGVLALVVHPHTPYHFFNDFLRKLYDSMKLAGVVGNAIVVVAFPRSSQYAITVDTWALADALEAISGFPVVDALALPSRTCFPRLLIGLEPKAHSTDVYEFLLRRWGLERDVHRAAVRAATRARANAGQPRILVINRAGDQANDGLRHSPHNGRVILNARALVARTRERYAVVRFVALEGMLSLRDQAEVLREADVVVMAHGSACISNWFMRKESVMVEVRPTEDVGFVSETSGWPGTSIGVTLQVGRGISRLEPREFMVVATGRDPNPSRHNFVVDPEEWDEVVERGVAAWTRASRDQAAVLSALS